MYPGRHEPRGAWAAKFSFLPNLILVENGRQAGASPSQKKESRWPWSGLYKYGFQRIKLKEAVLIEQICSYNVKWNNRIVM